MGGDVITLKTKNLNAKPFFADDIITSLEETLEHTDGDTNLILTMPDSIQARIDSSDKELWTRMYTAFSELDTGRTDTGAEVAIVSHGNIILDSPEIIRKAVEGGVIEGVMTNTYAGRLLDKEFKDLLDGKLPDGRETVLVHIDDLEREFKKLPKNYSIILDKDIRELESGYLDIENLRKHALFIAFCGNSERANKYLDEAGEKYGTGKYGCWHAFKDTDFDQPQGRFVHLSIGDYGGLGSYLNLIYHSCFAAVASEA